MGWGGVGRTKGFVVEVMEGGEEGGLLNRDGFGEVDVGVVRGEVVEVKLGEGRVKVVGEGKGRGVGKWGFGFLMG